MKFAIISDTHCLHRKLILPDSDVLIHCGDFTSRGKMTETINFLNWFEDCAAKYKILISGNHEFWDEQYPDKMLKECSTRGITYLNDSGSPVGGLKIWGSPITPFFNNFAFNRLRGAAIKVHWDLIPSETQILITHGPPWGIGDIVKERYGVKRVGCKDLANKITELKDLKLHCFGHIHSGQGKYTDNINGVTYINASQLDEEYKIAYAPMEFEC